MNHTSTPWSVSTHSQSIWGGPSMARLVARIPRESDAAHIVRCVNAHDNLVAATKSMIVAHRKLAGAAETEVVDRAIAAIAEAEAT